MSILSLLIDKRAMYTNVLVYTTGKVVPVLSQVPHHEDV